MNKDYYKDAFSAVYPSDEAIERILGMTEKRKRVFRHKGLIIVVAVIAALICGTFTVNAATDGALFGNIKIIIDGEEVNPEEYIKNYKTYVDEKGYKITTYDLYTPHYHFKSFDKVLLNGGDTVGETIEEIIINTNCKGGVLLGSIPTSKIN